MTHLRKAPLYTFGRRLLRASCLDGATFREVAEAPGFLGQAVVVVAVGGAARGVAAFATEGWAGIAASVVAGFVFWGVVSLVVRGASGWILPKGADLSALTTALGFAAAPLWTLSIVPWLPARIGSMLFWLSHAFAALAAIVAVREASGTTHGRALLICGSALLAGLLALLLIGFLFMGRGSYAGD